MIDFFNVLDYDLTKSNPFFKIINQGKFHCIYIQKIKM